MKKKISVGIFSHFLRRPTKVSETFTFSFGCFVSTSSTSSPRLGTSNNEQSRAVEKVAKCEWGKVFTQVTCRRTLTMKTRLHCWFCDDESKDEEDWLQSSTFLPSQQCNTKWMRSRVSFLDWKRSTNKNFLSSDVRQRAIQLEKN